MKFRFKVSDLNEAFSAISVVTPTPTANQAGYLFSLKITDGSDGTCSVYAQDGSRKAMTTFDVQNLDGEGSFAFPFDQASVFRYLDGYVDLESGETDNRHWIKYEAEGGADQEITTFDPLMLKPFDSEINEGEVEEYPSALLREGISSVKGFLADSKDSKQDDMYKSVQLFDAKAEKGSGYIYGTDHTKAAYFYSDVLSTLKGLAVHGRHLPGFLSFLSKCDKNVKVVTGKSMTYAVNGRNAFGWSHATKSHTKFAMYSFKMDSFVLRAPKELLIKALRFVKSGLNEKNAQNDRVRVEYSHKDQQLQFKASDSSSKITSQIVGVKAIQGDGDEGAGGLTRDFEGNLSLEQTLGLIEPIRGNEVTVRVLVKDTDGRNTLLLRTVEEYHLNDQGRLVVPSPTEKTYSCKVIRYAPSLR